MSSSMQPLARLPVLLGIHNLPVNPDGQVGFFAGWAVAVDGEEGVVVAGDEAVGHVTDEGAWEAGGCGAAHR